MIDEPPSIQSYGDLKKKFPYMFQTNRFEFYRGWLPLAVLLCEEIDAVLGADKREFRWTQIKEKFGGARFYYTMASPSAVEVEVGTEQHPLKVTVDRNPTDPVVRAIASLVAKATTAASTACQVCGAAAERRSYTGYLVTLCNNHQSKGPEDQSWNDALVEAYIGAKV
jgi:hypothetical protein